MLTSEDLKNIGIEVGKVVEQNITPSLDKIHGRLDGVEKRLSTVEATMVTKSYLDNKLAELEGSVIVRQRKEDQKVNLLIDLLRKKSVLQDTDVRSLNDIEVFPAVPRTLG